MNCPRCNATLPDNARFCLTCGLPIAAGAPASAAPPAPAAPTVAATSGAPASTTVKCPTCGAPLNPMFGDMVVTCDYCGGSVTLSGNGWKGVGRHTILMPTVTSPDAADPIVQRYLDQGFLHRKAFEESTITEQKLSLVPFWIVPTTATTNFTYQDVAMNVGTTVGSLVAAEALGSALGGRRGGGFLPVMPVMMGGAANATRQETISGQYEFPVVAVRGLSSYQPKNYQFRLTERTPFDKRAVPAGTPLLNGDLGQDAAAVAAKAYVTALQTELAHKKHMMVSQLTCDVQTSDAELLHAPIWYISLDRKGQKTIVLIDAHAGEIMQTVS